MSNPQSTLGRASIWPLIICLLVAVGFYGQMNFGWDASQLGLRPRDPSALTGIFTAPLVHSGLGHLLANLLPLFVCSLFIFYFFKRQALVIVGFCWLLTGILMFFFARSATHIGASGVVYALCFFLMSIGFWLGHRSLRIISVIMVFFYGSMVWGVLPIEEHVSWDGHLSGLVTGVICGLVFRPWIRKDYPPGGRVKDMKDEEDDEDDYAWAEESQK